MASVHKQSCGAAGRVQDSPVVWFWAVSFGSGAAGITSSQEEPFGGLREKLTSEIGSTASGALTAAPGS